MALATRPLGKSGMEITTVGFGAWAAGGGGWAFSWGAQDDGASIAAIKHAVSRGVNWIDTAAVYGLGHSEEVVGRAVRDIPAGSGIGYEHTFIHQASDFLEAIAQGNAAAPTFSDALATDVVTDAILKSARTGQWEKI
jgi:predicted dehydrogenase